MGLWGLDGRSSQAGPARSLRHGPRPGVLPAARGAEAESTPATLTPATTPPRTAHSVWLRGTRPQAPDHSPILAGRHPASSLGAPRDAGSRGRAARPRRRSRSRNMAERPSMVPGPPERRNFVCSSCSFPLPPLGRRPVALSLCGHGAAYWTAHRSWC